MKPLTHTISVFIVINIMTGGWASAQVASQERTLTIAGSTGLPVVTMQGLPGKIVTDSKGYYRVEVPSGWSGTVTPAKEGYSFSPASRNYTKVEQDRMHDDYTAKLIQFVISGSVGQVPGVMMQGLPGNPLTDMNGDYSVTVDYGWNGEVTPIKEGFSFSPSGKRYRIITRDMTREHYNPRQLSIIISGSVATAGVVMKGLPDLPVSDKNGFYSATVDYNWSGTVTPVKAGYTFHPPFMRYTTVMDDQPNQDFRPAKTGPTAMLGRSGGRKTLVVPADDIKAEELSEIMEDMQIMSHILDDRFKQKRQVQGLFTDFGDFFERNNRTTEATYLEGYGILFSMEVNFAFTPPTELVKDAEKIPENIDPTWQNARRQVFQPGASQRFGISESTEVQSHQMVKELKKDLIETLKHAANIRVLQPDEWIILTLIGNSRGFGGMMGGMGGMMGSSGGMMGSTGGMMSSMRGSYGGGSSSGGGGGFGGGMSGGYGGSMAMGGRMSGMGMGGMAGGMGGGMGGMMGGMGMGRMGASSTTVLTIRAKKSDVDAFAKGELNIEQFQEKVKTVMY